MRSLLSVLIGMSAVVSAGPLVDIYAVYNGFSKIPSFEAVPVGTQEATGTSVTWPGASGPVRDIATLVQSIVIGIQMGGGTQPSSVTFVGYFYQFNTGQAPTTMWWSQATGFVATPTWLGSSPSLISQTISFGALSNHMVGDQPFTISATATSGLPVSFTSNTPSVCTLAGNSVSPLAAGTCSITANQAGNASFAAASAVTQSFTIAPRPAQSQTISFGPLPDHTLGDAAFSISAIATSGLPVSFVSATPSVCALAGATVSLLSAGTCSITASQSGNSGFSAAAPVTQSFTIGPRPLQAQTISFIGPPDHTFGDPAFPVGATASSGLPVSFTSATTPVCSISGAMVSIASVGTCSITASQGGNASYNAAPSVTQSFVVRKAGQTITFAPIAAHSASDPPFALQATATSGLPVSFAVLSGPATVNGSTLSLTGAGQVSVQALQTGSANYNAATPVTQTFQIASPAPAISAALNAASFAAGSLAPGSYASLFGSNLAATPGDPTTTVRFKDVSGKQSTATLVYVGPGQVNVLVPGDLVPGPATLTVATATGASTPFSITISAVSPGLFTMDPAEKIPAAQLVIVAADGSQSVQPVANCVGTPVICTALTIPLRSDTKVYLVLYGTGIRGAGSTDRVAVTIGGVAAVVSYAGPQGGYPGLDQINVLIPTSLAGQTKVDLKLSVEGVAANTVQLSF